MKAHLQPQPGLKDLALLLDVISDPKKYKKIIKEQDEMLKDINDSIEIKVSLDGIETMKSEAASNLRASKKMLADSEEKAKEIKAEPMQALKNKEKVLLKKDKEMLAKYDEFSESLVKLQEALDLKEADLQKQEDKLRAISDKLTSKEITLTGLQSSLEEKTKLMKDTAATIG